MGYSTEKGCLNLSFTFSNRSDLLTLCSEILQKFDERICYQSDYKELLTLHVKNAMHTDTYPNNKSFILPLAQKIYRTYDLRAKNNPKRPIGLKTIYNELVNIWNELNQFPDV